MNLLRTNWNLVTKTQKKMAAHKNGNGRSEEDPIESVSGNNFFDERSEAAQEIISRKPTFIEKWALLIFMVLLLCLVIATWFIKYPEIVTGRVILWGEKSPKEIVSGRSGRLISVFAKNNQLVKRGETLAWFESSAATQEVVDLAKEVEKGIQHLKNKEFSSILSLFTTPSYQLGELQLHYQEFNSILSDYKRNAPVSSSPGRMSNTENQTLKQYAKLEEALYILRSHIDNWFKQYTLQSPTDGQVAFIAPVQQDKYIAQGTLLGYIIPHNDKYYAEVKILQKDLGKVDTGMNVQLRFDAYAYQEAGIVYGKLTELSKIAVDSLFTATVLLNNGLITSQNKAIPFSNGLKGEAIIITKDIRLLKRFYYKLFR